MIHIQCNNVLINRFTDMNYEYSVYKTYESSGENA